MFIYDHSSTVPVPLLVEGANNLSKTFVKCKKTQIRYPFFFLFLFRKPVEKTRENPYPFAEGTGFARVQIYVPGPVPQGPLPVTLAGFETRGIP